VSDPALQLAIAGSLLNALQRNNANHRSLSGGMFFKPPSARHSSAIASQNSCRRPDRVIVAEQTLNNPGWKLFNALFPRTLEIFARRFASWNYSILPITACLPKTAG